MRSSICDSLLAFGLSSICPSLTTSESPRTFSKGEDLQSLPDNFEIRRNNSKTLNRISKLTNTISKSATIGEAANNTSAGNKQTKV
jgi:hypothetical protein